MINDAEKITLGQLLQYADPDTDIRIQIVMSGEEWDNATEVWTGSELLTPWYDHKIAEIGYEKSFHDATPIIRVGLERP